MMRIAGRDYNAGIAKAVSVTEKGEIKTGSLLEIGKRRLVEIEPGQTLVVFDKAPVHTNMFFYSIRTINTHEFEVGHQWNVKDPDSAHSYVSSVLHTETYNRQFANSERFPVFGDRLWLIIKNKSTETQTYDVYAFGVESNTAFLTDEVKMLNEDLLENANTLVEPGSYYVSPSRIGVGSSLGVAVQLRNAGQFEIYVSYRGRNHQREMARELIYRSDEGAMYGGGRTDKITNQYAVFIKNIGNTSFDIRDLVITDFI